jgi:hypothetical protein
MIGFMEALAGPPCMIAFSDGDRFHFAGKRSDIYGSPLSWGSRDLDFTEQSS